MRQRDFEIEQYVEACATVARFEARMRVKEELGLVSSGDNSDLVTRKQISEQLHIDEKTIRNWERDELITRVPKVTPVSYRKQEVIKVKKSKGL